MSIALENHTGLDFGGEYPVFTAMPSWNALPLELKLLIISHYINEIIVASMRLEAKREAKRELTDAEREQCRGTQGNLRKLLFAFPKMRAPIYRMLATQYERLDMQNDRKERSAVRLCMVVFRHSGDPHI